VLCCNGYKPDIIGWLAARRAGIPVVSTSHGWTAATWKVWLNEALDRFMLRRFDAIVCVSEAQAVRVRRCGVEPDKIAVIRNAVNKTAFVEPDPGQRATLENWFSPRPTWIVGAAGRLSPEKGFAQLVETAAVVVRKLPNTGFVLFGDGPQRQALQRAIARHGLEGRFIFAGFRSDIAAFLPNCDVVALPSFTEGMPVVVLEAMAAGVPVVATAVGGTPEVVVEGVTGHLVAAGDPAQMAQRLVDLLPDKQGRICMGSEGRQRAKEHFTFGAQCEAYLELFDRLSKAPSSRNSSRHLVSSLD
jgi:glycosyltransferase involved in cell wall biosynthesis